MDIFKKPECMLFRKIKGNGQCKSNNAGLESSVTSVSASTSLCSQQTTCSGYDYARSLYKSVIDDSISSNVSKILHDSSGLHSSIKDFGQTALRNILNNSKEWQIEGFVEKHKEMKTRAAMSKGNLLQKKMTFDRWWCVLTQEHGLCLRGFLENKKDEVETEPIIKRMDSHTVASRNSLYKLKKFCGENCEPSLPHSIKNRFACGFPEDWKLLKRKWLMFSKQGEQQDFQWKENDDAASSESHSVVLQNPSGQFSQGKNCEEFTNKTQERSFTFPPLVAKNKSTERFLTVRVEKLCTKNIGNWLHSEEERTNHVAKRSEPQCSNSDTITKKNFLSNRMSFEIISDDGEDSGIEGVDILNPQTNCQDRKSKDNQYGNMKQHYKSKDKQYGKKKKQSKSKYKQCGNKEEESGVRRTNTKQTSVGNEILLEKWLPVLNENELCFRGVRTVGCAKESYTTASVKSRSTSDTVTLVDGNTCKLIGQLYDEHNCLPADIVPKFKSGVPQYWRKEVAKWLAYSKSTESAYFSCCFEVESAASGASSHLNKQQQGILKTSSRGRILLQPVKHWLGETPSSVINNIVDHTEEKQVDLLNSECSHPSPAEKILSRTSDKEKCGTENKPDPPPSKNVKNSLNSKRKKELADKKVKKSRKEQQPCRPDSDKVVDRNPLGGNSCPVSQFENPTFFADSERRVLRSRNKQAVTKKESFNVILDENKSDGIDKNAVSHISHSRNKTNRGKLKERSTIPVLGRDDKDTTSVGKSKQTMKKTNKKYEVCPLKPSDLGIGFTDFLGKPPRTLKQRKRLDKIVKTLSQNNKNNVDLFDDTLEGQENSRMEWSDFVAVNHVASFTIGEETPRSKMFNGSYFKTPENSPSQSIFQITPHHDNELRKYVHQQKTKKDKAVNKTDTKRTKLSFMHTSSGNPAKDEVYGAFLKGELFARDTMSKEMRADTDDSYSFVDSSC